MIAVGRKLDRVLGEPARRHARHRVVRDVDPRLVRAGVGRVARAQLYRRGRRLAQLVAQRAEAGDVAEIAQRRGRSSWFLRTGLT
jgi:hypothetical protein